MANIYNVNAGVSFVDVLAETFLKKYQTQPEELNKVLFLLPNRRACQSLVEAFVRHHELKPTILPRILPIADVEEDEVFLTGKTEIIKDLKPEISKTERVLIFTRLIRQKPTDLGLGHLSLAQSYALAKNLADLIDLAYNENLDFSHLKEIVPAEYATHWQESLTLLEIITQNWPEILSKQGVVDATYRRNQLLRAELEIWQQSQTQQKIVVAGTTAAFPLLKKLVKTVIDLPNGEVWFYGLDNFLDESAWQQIDENHPQFELKELLDYLKIDRSMIVNLPQNLISTRERFVSEIMRPATNSSEWRRLPLTPLSSSAIEGIHLLNCGDIRQEAQAIALLMRQVLKIPEKTVALVTMDRNLARRVVSELKRWNITADDSAGQPLGLTPIGVYLRLIIKVLEDNFSEVSLLSLLKHPFTSCGQDKSSLNQSIRFLEVNWRQKIELTAQQEELLMEIKSCFQPLNDLFAEPYVNIKELFLQHIKTAEKLAATDVKSGDKIIWKSDSGTVAAKFVTDFVQKSELLGDIRPQEYLSLLEEMLSEQNVRVRYGMHPRIKILGPIEARLNQFDVTIIGEVNEGVWPKLPASDMWMSRPMKKEFGFPLPERSIGVTAADFAHLLNAKEVYLTRAERVDGTPTGKSRWWLRMETVLAANFGLEQDQKKFETIIDKKYTVWAKFWERAKELKRIAVPHPCPPSELRPKKLSAVNFEMLMRDPYAIYAKYILHLYPLQKLDEDVALKDYGNIVHSVIEKFNNQYNDSNYPEDAKDLLIDLGEKEFANNHISAEVKAFWWPKFLKTIDWLVAEEKVYRPEISKVHNEINGSIKVCDGKFTITAKADRIDETKTGGLNILDYKTGKGRKEKDVKDGFAPQLPIEAIIAQNGGFEGIPAKKVLSLRYWELGKDEIPINEEQSQQGCKITLERIENYMTTYDDKNQPYLPKPRVSLLPTYSDYDHLSRILEWSVKDENNEN